MAYETALIFGFLGISWYLMEFAEKFRMEENSLGRAIVKMSTRVLLQMSSLASAIFAVQFLYLIMQDQVQSATVLSILALFDGYLQYFYYAVMLFFTLFFLNEFLHLLSNFKLNSIFKSEEKKQKGSF